MAILDDGTISVAFDPDWDIQRRGERLIAESVSISGRRATYRWGDYQAFAVPVRYMPASDAMQVNEWWRNGTAVNFADAHLGHFTLDDAYWGLLDEAYNPLYGTTHAMRITNGEPPFTQYVRPYQREYQGTILLEAV